MTAPDFRDWVPPQGLVSSDQSIYGSPGGSENLPINATINVAPWNSVSLALTGVGVSVFTPAAVVIYFSDGVFASWVGFVTCDMNNSSSQGDSGLVWNLPVLGTYMTISMSGNLIGAQGNLQIAGSTRQSSYQIRPALYTQTSPASLSGNITVPANSTSLVGFVGPYTNGIHAAMAGPPTTHMNLYTYGLEAGGLTARGVGGPVGNSNGYNYSDIECPGALLQCTLTNTDTGSAHGIPYSLSGQA